MKMTNPGRSMLSDGKVIFVIFALAFTAYSFMLSAPFKTLDDNVSIIHNENIKSLANIGRIFRSSFFEDKMYYRPLVSVSFMIEYHFVDLNPFFYNLTNLLIHIFTTLLVFILVNRIFKDRLTGFFTALLFAIHPIQWEAICNISGRAILLCAFFYIGSFLFFVSGRTKAQPTVHYVLSFVLFIMALLAKESAAMLPFVMLAYVFFFEKETKDTKWASLRCPLVFFAGLAAYGFIRQQLGMTQLYLWPSLESLSFGVLTFLRATLTYLRLFIFPIDLHFDRSRELFVSFFNGELLGTVLTYLGGAVFLIKFKEKISRAIWFCLFWFFANLVLTSQIVSIGVQPGRISTAEHFLYIPSVGAFILMVFAARSLYRKSVERKVISKEIFSVFAAAFFIFLFLVTVQQGIYASSEIAMLRQSLLCDPRNARIQSSLGLKYAEKKQFKEAEVCLRKALMLDPTSTLARIGLGKALCDQNRYFEGIAEYEKIINPNRKWKKLLERNLKLSYEILTKQYQAILAKNPSRPDWHYSLAVVYSKQGKIEEAVLEYQRAIQLKGDFKNACFNLASIYEAQGKLQEAAHYFEKAVESGQKDIGLDDQSYRRLGKIYQRLGNLQKSKEYQDASLKIGREAQAAKDKLPRQNR